MKAFIFVLIQFLGILKCNSQNTGELSSPEAGTYKSLDQTAGGLNDAGTLKAPSEILIEPVDALPPGMNPPPPPPPPIFNPDTAGNQKSNIQISYPELIPTPSGASYPKPGESPVVNVNSGGTVIKEWLPTNVKDMLNLPKENTGLNVNSFQSKQQSVEYPVPAKQVINVFGNQAKYQSGATLLDNGSYMLPGNSKPSNPSVTKNTAGVFVDGGLNTGSQSNAATDPMNSYFYNEARIDNSLPTDPGFKLNEAASLQNVKNFIDTEKKSLASALGMVNQGLANSEEPNNCELYRPFPLNRMFYMEKIHGKYEIRPCAPGTSYNITKCSCLNVIPPSYNQNTNCSPQMHATFTTGFNDHTNKTRIGNRNTQLINGHAYFNGVNAMLILWKFAAFDFRQKMTIQFRFKPDRNHHYNTAQPLIINCQLRQFLSEGAERKPPSIAIVLNTGGQLVTFVIITDEQRNKPEGVVLPIHKDNWNTVTLVYDGAYMHAEVNGERKRRELKGNIENPFAPLAIGHCERYGYFAGEIDDVKIYGQCDPNVLNL